MANFSKTERKLIELINEPELVTSLHLLREAAEKIWSSETPRIIQDYTDHGIKHYERIIEYVSLLLEINSSSSLSSRELYLLIAGVYTHDVGMQCDPILNDKINKIAIGLGATYENEVSADSSNTFNYQDQKQIRKNHQFLSAAWISHAFKTSETALGYAAKSIPSELVKDLMDICIHHTKVPISNCPVAFEYDPSGRKQFVAALLRFADELDIDSSRVNIDTIKNFRVPPENAIYWYIHNSTKITLKDNLVHVAVRINKKDFSDFSDSIENIFIRGFETKNKPVLDVLAKNGVVIRISNESKVVEDEYIEAFPELITSALRVVFSEKEDPLNELSNEMKLWLEALNYDVRIIRLPENNKHVLRATLNSGTIKQNLLIHCIGSEILVRHVEELEEELDRHFPEGWLVCDTRILPSAREKASELGVQIFNLSDFLNQKVWSSYIQSIKSIYETEKIGERYVQVDCYKSNVVEEDNQQKEVKDPCGNLDKYIENWISERGKNHLSVLGDFGSGKTWFCRHLTYTKMQEYLGDPINKRLPLLITLRDFTKAVTPEQLINDAFIEKYKLTFVGSSYKIFQELNKRGKILLILDGFDEMANKVNKQTIVDNFWELTKLVNQKSKVILTSRTEYFRWAEESETILGGEEKGRSTLELTPPKFEVLYLEPFTEEQIKEAIIRQLGKDKGALVAEKVLSIKNLAEMSRKPILIQLLLSIVEEIDPYILENSAQVYLYATNKLLLRNINIRRTFTSVDDKLFFLCELAWEMIENNSLSIHYSSIPDIIKHFFGSKVDDRELDHWDFDLRSQTLLHRNVAGYYRFSHKSIAEYFVAYKFAAELGCLLLEYMNAYHGINSESSSHPIRVKNLEELQVTFGKISLEDERMKAVKQFLVSMVDKGKHRLWDIYKECIGDSRYDVLAKNCIYLLAEIGDDFIGRDISNSEFEYLDLANRKLTDAKLRNCKLTRPYLYNCDLGGADLENSQIIFHDGVYTLSDVRGANCFVIIKNRVLVSVGSDYLHFDDFIDLSKSFKIPIPEGVSVYDLKLSHDEKYIAVVSRKKTFLFEIDTREHSSIQFGTFFLRDLTFDFHKPRFCLPIGDGWPSKTSRILVCSYDTQIVSQEIQFEYGEIFCCCFTINQNRLVAGGRGGQLIVFDIDSKRVLSSKKIVDSYIYSIACLDENTLLVGTTDRELKVFDLATMTVSKRIPTNISGKYYTRLSLSKNRKYLAATSNHGVDVYLVEDWSIIRSFDGFERVNFSDDSCRFAIGNDHERSDIIIIDSESMEEKHSFSHAMDFSKTNIRGLHAPLSYIKFFIDRGAKNWYTKEELVNLDIEKYDNLLSRISGPHDMETNMSKKEQVDYIFNYLKI